MKVRAGLIAVLLLTGCGGGSKTKAENKSDAIEPATNASTNMSAQPSVDCAAVEKRVSVEDCEVFKRDDAGLRTGVAAFNAPDPMRRGDTTQVTLVIDRRSPREIRVIEGPRPEDVSRSDPNLETAGPNNCPHPEPPAAAAAAGGGSAPTPAQALEEAGGTVHQFYPCVGRHMKAELFKHDGLEVVPLTPAQQDIPLHGNATWRWDVTALEGGAQSLTLVIVAEGGPGPPDQRLPLARWPPIVRRINVEVSWNDRLLDGVKAAPVWLQALTAVVVALGALLTALYALPRWRRRKAGGAEPPPDAPGG